LLAVNMRLAIPTRRNRCCIWRMMAGPPTAARRS